VKEDPELETNDTWSEDNAYLSKRKGSGSGNKKSLWILLGILLILIFAGGIAYFLSKQSAGREATPLESKVAALEEKFEGLDKQLAELQGKISTPGTDPALLRRVDALAQKVETLERQKGPADDSKSKPSAASKPTASSSRQYHTVQKGETVQGISKKYRISVEELRKLNNLSPDQALRSGQKLLVSTAR
jgi:LysM repeat protein